MLRAPNCTPSSPIKIEPTGRLYEKITLVASGQVLARQNTVGFHGWPVWKPRARAQTRRQSGPTKFQPHLRELYVTLKCKGPQNCVPQMMFTRRFGRPSLGDTHERHARAAGSPYGLSPWLLRVTGNFQATNSIHRSEGNCCKTGRSVDRCTTRCALRTAASAGTCRKRSPPSSCATAGASKACAGNVPYFLRQC